MTTEQKQLIHRLRVARKDYQSVAAELGLKIGTVKTYCFRHGLTNADIEEQEQNDICPCCGASITQRQKVKPRRFCSDKCRIKWWNDNRDLQNKKAFTRSLCEGCGEELISYGSKNRKYCSHACYVSRRFGMEETADDSRTV
ncbi:MAG: RNA polymerase subunit sigma-70 [Bacillota bacterium]|nr:RNA polymerase subunit sigma-70 [Bacillota bacterium]